MASTTRLPLPLLGPFDPGKSGLPRHSGLWEQKGPERLKCCGRGDAAGLSPALMDMGLGWKIPILLREALHTFGHRTRSFPCSLPHLFFYPSLPPLVFLGLYEDKPWVSTVDLRFQKHLHCWLFLMLMTAQYLSIFSQSAALLLISRSRQCALPHLHLSLFLFTNFKH